MTDPSWRYGERPHDPGPSRRRSARAAPPPDDGYADLYRGGGHGYRGDGAPPGTRRAGGRDTGQHPAGYGWPPEPGRRQQRGWGMLTSRHGIAIVAASAAAGAFATVVTGGEPGGLLDLLLVAGAVAAALAVHPQAVARLIPVPALAGAAAAALAGLVHDRAVDGSVLQLAVHALQWLASGFYAMAAATLAVIVIAVVRSIRYARQDRD